MIVYRFELTSIGYGTETNICQTRSIRESKTLSDSFYDAHPCDLRTAITTFGRPIECYVTSGVAQRKELDLDFEDDSETTVHVMVHDLKPPFLDGTVVFTTQLEPINPIRDPTSDMAIFSRKGSALVKEKREQAERAEAAAELANLSGTALGNLVGVKDEEAEAEEKAEGPFMSSPFA